MYALYSYFHESISGQRITSYNVTSSPAEMLIFRLSSLLISALGSFADLLAGSLVQ